MTYRRVLPRDLFNESSLLKCYGRLWIALDQAGLARFSEDDMGRFEIEQRESDGSIYIANLKLHARGETYLLTRPLNSRRSWPLYAEPVDGDGDPIEVFDNQGGLSEEFVNRIYL